MSSQEFDQLIKNDTDFLKPFAITLTHDPEKASDLFQETLYRALVNREKYQAGTNIRAWLYTIMRNIFINDYRRREKQRSVLDSVSSGFASASESTTLNDGISTLQVKEIRAAIHRLPGIFRNPFLMYMDGYRYHEIAGMLCEPLGTVKSRIHFARKQLKDQLSRY
ncbi:RNA polymerase sigma factor [Sediminibacterium ginsengisoli]|uniref:RNA polymerase sigma-70 factor, ECF subfamily n=1 Tax=Sediminibacterium ginsengisoli TaxID=413434 RepID=A0A1T4JUN7_9BACT|nr:RNA polymerase sigma factor [Sediminibacterium ginsengisoli]SJZ33886.1 RNA polymerase sigma-70 factor, ECF subfamily [Sediminibacterium ginsengisoli]